MKIYLAARYSRRDELAAYARELVLLGHHVTSRWLTEEHLISDEQLNDGIDALRLGRRYALEDLADVAAADLLIAFSEPPRSTNSRGGRHAEVGIALALGRPVWLVGPLENVFHALNDAAFADWRGVVHALGLLADTGLAPTAVRA